MRPMRFPPFMLGCQLGFGTVQVFFRRPCCWDFYGCFPATTRRHNVTTDFLVLRLLRAFFPFTCNVPWALGSGMALEMYQAAKGEDSWSSYLAIKDLWITKWLGQQDISQWWNRGCLILGVTYIYQIRFKDYLIGKKSCLVLYTSQPPMAGKDIDSRGEPTTTNFLNLCNS